MRGTAPYRCDAEGCEATRERDSNHWLVMWVIPGGNLVIAKWNDEHAEGANSFHVCGSNHASILLARWLATGTLERT